MTLTVIAASGTPGTSTGVTPSTKRWQYGGVTSSGEVTRGSMPKAETTKS
jgi:hypothetical protein